MKSTQFHLVTEWQLKAPLEVVWGLLTTPEDWPKWWRAVKKVEVIEPRTETNLGVMRMTWGTALPYNLSFTMHMTRYEPMSLIEGEARGELDGLGRWSLREEGGITHVRYDWIVELSKPWMRAFAPLLKPVFAWNHQTVMGWGLEGIRRRLGLKS